METNDEGMPKDPCPHDMDRALIEAAQLHQHLRTDMPRLKGRAARPAQAPLLLFLPRLKGPACCLLLLASMPPKSGALKGGC